MKIEQGLWMLNTGQLIYLRSNYDSYDPWYFEGRLHWLGQEYHFGDFTGPTSARSHNDVYVERKATHKEFDEWHKEDD